MTFVADPLEARVLPHHLAAEKAVLGGILIDGQRFGDAVEYVGAEHFYRHAHGTIFHAMQMLARETTAIDFLTVKDHLLKTDALEAIDGPAYLAALADGVPRSSNVAEYARIVRDHADRRELIRIMERVRDEAYAGDVDASHIIDRAQQAIFDLRRNEQRGFVRLSAIIPGVMEQLEAWCRTKSTVNGLPSGFHDLDDLTRGFQPGNLIIIAARPSMGKTALALNIAQHVAGRHETVAIFSLEMSETELAVRALTAAADIDGHRLQSGHVRESEWGRIAAAMGDLSELPLYIDPSPYVTAFEIRARARRLKAEHGLSLLIVDYTQLMIGQDKHETRTLELAAITRELKALAKDLKMPVLALSQLSRKVEERSEKRPMLSDLRESGSLEQDADVVIFIYRDEVYDRHTDEPGIAELIIGKHRNGQTGTVKVGWRAEQTRFVNLTTEAAPEDRRLPMGDR